MPTYQYACTECGHRLEAVQSFTAEPLTECPQCDGRLRKVFNSVGIVFKGSGFYRNDSREKPAAKGEKSDSDKADKSGDTKPVDAPAAKDSAKTAKSSSEKSSANGSAKPSTKPTASSSGSSGSSPGSSTAGSAA